VLKADLPDMTLEDTDVSVDNGALSINGEKRFLT
jgi:HSP20 family molecular chaperone IbpA